MNQYQPCTLCCSNCQQPMRTLNLAGHYKRRVEIDLCPSCLLLWFDDNESVRLAAPGVMDLMPEIHSAISRYQPVALNSTLHCPLCQRPLRSVYNVSRFGRTRQFQCPVGHGYIQTFWLYLAEKGLIRPLRWADLQQLSQTGTHLFCVACGANLDGKPHETCPYCDSAVGVLDPARLASAIDTQQAAEPLTLEPQALQSHCPECGGTIDLSQHASCPHCTTVLHSDKATLVTDVHAALEDQVRQNYESQSAKVSAAKFDQLDHLSWRPSTETTYSTRTLSNRRKIDKLQAQLFVAKYLLMAFGLIFVFFVIKNRIEDHGAESPNLAKDTPPTASTISINTTKPEPAPSPVLSGKLPPVKKEVASYILEEKPTLAEMFSFPSLKCAADSDQRSAVRIRQITILPNSNKTSDIRTAYQLLAKVRGQLVDGARFNQVKQQLDTAIQMSEINDGHFYSKGTLPVVVEKVAFCIPARTISPIFRSGSDFTFLEVLALR